MKTPPVFLTALLAATLSFAESESPAGPQAQTPSGSEQRNQLTQRAQLRELFTFPVQTVGNALRPRTWRDGANQITFIDLSQPIPSDGAILSWSFYAQKFAHAVISDGPRQVKLQIFRPVADGYQLVVESPYYTVGRFEWDRVHWVISQKPMWVKKGDLIGWHYPTQGNSPLDGGVIAFQSGTRVRTVWDWNQNRTARGESPMPVGTVIPAGNFAGWEDGRTYSIEVKLASDLSAWRTKKVSSDLVAPKH